MAAEAPSGVINGHENNESGVAAVTRNDFPDDFLFGVATSAYQVEGAISEGGKGPSIWDVFSHTPGKICDGSNGDIAVDQYHRIKEDVELIANIGFDVYRFSISWPRIFPDGSEMEVNNEGLAYYNNLINELLEKGIKPAVTLYHWDLPHKLHESKGGWLNKEIIKYFAQYAEACFHAFGDRVKLWITINEPLQTAVNGYATGLFAPGRCSDRLKSPVGDSFVEPYLVAHHQLLAHAAAVHIYRHKFQDKQKGTIGISVDGEGAEPFSDAEEDRAAAQRRLEFQLGWFLDPIFFGDYPTVMREKLGIRLPQFSSEEASQLRGSVDFVGLNHYTTRYVKSAFQKTQRESYSDQHGNKLERDIYDEQEIERIAEWDGNVIGDKAASKWLYIVPWGFKKTLKWLTERYGRPLIYVTENGMDDEDNEALSIEHVLDDSKRVGYFEKYLRALSEAIREGVDVRGYFAWSLLDNFEWSQGYTKRFGIVYVDYKNGQKRHLKSSAHWFRNFLHEAKI